MTASGVGSLGNFHVRSQADSDQFNIKTRAALGDPEALEQLDADDPDNLSAEQIRAAHDLAVRADATLTTRSESAEEFLALCPEFLDTQANGDAMNKTLHALFGDVAFTTDHFLKAYEVLNATNALSLDQVVIVKRKQAEANERAKAAREKHARETRVFSESEKENMSLEELREAENREIKRRMQLAGERGGNDW
jgi:hypothetical protein